MCLYIYILHTALAADDCTALGTTGVFDRLSQNIDVQESSNTKKVSGIAYMYLSC